MQYTEIELKELIKAVETEFAAELAKAEVSAQPAPLAKAEDEKKDESPSEDKKESEAPAKEEPKEEKEAPKAEEKKDEAPAEEGKEAAPEKEAAPAAEEKPVAPSADEGASGYDAEDIAHMDAMYMSMSKAELLAHHDSCVRALDAIGAEHVHAAPAAPAAEAPAAPAAPAAEIDKCGDMSMAKSEKDIEIELVKSEIAAEKAKNAELQKSLDTVSEFLTKLVKKVPQGKAITQFDQVAKSESEESEKQLSKSEITEILKKKAADPSLSKTDRDAINAYYLNQSNVNTISHLLK